MGFLADCFLSCVTISQAASALRTERKDRAIDVPVAALRGKTNHAPRRIFMCGALKRIEDVCRSCRLPLIKRLGAEYAAQHTYQSIQFDCKRPKTGRGAVRSSINEVHTGVLQMQLRRHRLPRHNSVEQRIPGMAVDRHVRAARPLQRL